MAHIPTVSREELLKIPYVVNSPTDRRTVFLNPFFDAEQEKWELPFPQEHKIIFLKAEPIQMCYYSDKKLGDSDLFLKLIDYTARYFSFNPALYSLLGIIKDIFNCGVVVERYFLYLDMFRKNKNTSIMNFVSADLEFLFSNIRSAYDSLQYLISAVWYIEKKKKLPKNFSNAIKCDASALTRKYDLPRSIISCYQSSKDFFEKCKKIRDGIHHLSMNTQIVYCLEDGFALQKDNLLNDPIAKYFDIWSPDKTKKNGLVSILALYAHLTRSFIDSTESFSESLKESISKVPIISPNYKLFLRGPYLRHLVDSGKYLKEHWIIQ
jgi:hypothetical protein